jgi:5-methylcytosine-specific restriction endonuclease McrA
MKLSDVFQMPTPMKISGRSSSITAAFVTAIVPQVEPLEEEIREALNILEMSPDRMECVYCGGSYSEWDHLRPLVSDQKPTGFITEIRNLVPSCGKCNQSKGNKDWKAWMTSDAKLSPKTRGVKDIGLRIARLTKYEQWGNLVPLDLSAFVTKEEWDQYWENWKALLRAMNDTQKHAASLKATIQKKISSSNKAIQPTAKGGG